MTGLLAGHCSSQTRVGSWLCCGFVGDGGEGRRAGRLTEQQSNERNKTSLEPLKIAVLLLHLIAKRSFDFSLLQCIFCTQFTSTPPHPDHVTLVPSCHNLHSISPKGLGMRYNRCLKISSANSQSGSCPTALS